MRLTKKSQKRFSKNSFRRNRKKSFRYKKRKSLKGGRNSLKRGRKSLKGGAGQRCFLNSTNQLCPQNDNWFLPKLLDPAVKGIKIGDISMKIEHVYRDVDTVDDNIEEIKETCSDGYSKFSLQSVSNNIYILTSNKIYKNQDGFFYFTGVNETDYDPQSPTKPSRSEKIFINSITHIKCNCTQQSFPILESEDVTF